MARSMKLFLARKWLAGAFMLVLACLGAAALTRAAEEDKGVLANLISKALSSPSTQVSVGAVDGALSSNALISNIVLSDRDGPWLKIDKVKLVWNRLALFSRRLEVDQLQIGKLEFLRRPPPAAADPNAPKADDGPILPDLPLKVIIKQFGVEELSLGAPVVGAAARLTMSGAATLGPPSEGLDLRLDAHRLDAEGAFLARLAFVPDTKALTIALKFDEPAGGLLAHVANIPGQPPVKFNLDGAGALDAFKASLFFEAGPTIGANGHVDLHRDGPGRRLALNLQSRLEGLLPSFAGAIFAGETALEGDVFLNDNAAIAISSLHLTSATARLDVAGGVSPDQKLDVTIHAGAIPNAQDRTRAGAADIAKLEFNATAKGPLSGPQIVAKIEAEQVRVPQGALEKLTADFSAQPSGAFSDPATRIAFAAEAEASGLSLADRAWNEALGRTMKFTLRGSASSEGEAQIDDFHLALPSLNATYQGLIGPKTLHGALALQAPDLSRFAGLATIALKGSADLAADLDGAPREGAVTATVHAHASNFATGIAAADGFTGPQWTLAGAAESLPHGGFGFQNLVLTGAHGSARLDGAAQSDHADVRAVVDVPEARFLDPRIAGKAQINAALTGTLRRLDAQMQATLREGQLLGRSTPEIALQAKAQNITGLVDAEAKLNGEIDRKTLDGGAHIAKRTEGGWRADGLALNLGSAHLSGDLTLDANNLAQGRLAASAGNLDDLSPLILTKLSGAIESHIVLEAPEGRQNASIAARSARLGFGANALEGLDADLTLSDLRGRPTIAGAANLAKALIAGQAIGDLRLTAKSAPDASDLDLGARVRGLAVKAQARLFAASPPRVDLTSLSVQGNGQRIVLAGPASIAKTDDGVSVKGLVLSVNNGRVTLDGVAGEKLDLKLAATGVPLSAADLAAPGLGLTGALDANAAISGTPGDLAGDWRVKITRLTAPQTRSIALPAIDAAASGRLGGGRTTLDAAINAGALGELRAAGSAPLSSAGDLDLKIQGKLNAAAANSLLGASGQRVAGNLTIDAQLRGPVTKPQAQGAATLTEGSFADADLGLKLERIAGRISARGDQIVIERIDASTPNGGTLNAKGQVRLDPAGGFPGAIHIAGQKAQLIASDVVGGSADLALDVNGPLAQNPTVRGRVDIQSMDISIPERLSGAIRPLDGVRHVNPGPTARARLAMEAKARKAAAHAPPFNAQLDITVATPGRIFVRGRGLFAELGGDLKVGGAIANPQIRGGFNLRSGSLALLGQKLSFTRGDVVFHGGIMPELDFLAETAVADITARIAVSGPASQPTFTFSSIPSLPQDEILSRILFQKPSGNLSGFQALELANAVSTLSGGNDSFEKLRKSLGVDSLDVGSGPSGGPTVGVTRAINDRISIGVTAGAKSEDSGVSVNLDVTRHLRLQGGVDADGGTSVGIGTQWEYK
jgi:translocation and assembly module TamB